MKTAVYSWRLSSARKANLEDEARRGGISLSALLDSITSEWLAARRNGRHHDDEAEQAALRKRVFATVGTICGGDPTRSARTSELVREIIVRKQARKSRALRRPAQRTH